MLGEIITHSIDQQNGIVPPEVWKLWFWKGTKYVCKSVCVCVYVCVYVYLCMYVCV